MISQEEEKIIQEWMHKDLAEFALHFSGSDLPVAFLIDQIKGRQKISEKFPFLEEIKRYVFPPYLSIEQSSSMHTAYAKRFFITGEHVLDMTGGMGIDSYFIAMNADKVTYVEQNIGLCEINSHNFSVMGSDNIEVIHGDSVEYLRNCGKKFDVLYIDPARRSVDGNRKVFLLEDLRPNVLEIMPLMWEHTDIIWIKLSPLIDITYLGSVLEDIKEVVVVSYKNEVKEVLVHIEKTKNENDLEEYEDDAGPQRVAMNINQELQFSMVSDDLYSPTRTDTFFPFEQYIYEPTKATIKAGLADKMAELAGLKKMQSNTYFYSLNKRVPGWDGRIFKVERILSARPKQFRKEFPYKKANIISRNHPMSAPTIAKKFGLTSGGDHYILAFQDVQGRHIVSATRLQ